MKKYILLMLITCVFIFSCFSPLDYDRAGETTLTVMIGGVNAGMGRSVGTPDDFRYDLVFTGPRGQIIKRTVSLGQEIKEKVKPGIWHVDVIAKDPSAEIETPDGTGIATIAIGTQVIVVEAGKDNLVTIQMAFTDIRAVEPYLIWATGGETLEDDPINLHLAMELDNYNFSNWTSLLEAIANAEKYVNLNLSLCTYPEYTDSGPLVYRFDPFNEITWGKEWIVELTLPDMATEIVDGSANVSAFAEFVNLKIIDLGNDLERIGDYAFNNLNLEDIIMPDTITYIGDYAFNNNRLLKIIIPDNVITIGEYSFNSNSISRENQMNSVIVGNSVNNIGNYAFSNNNIFNVVIPDNVITIGEYAFYNNKMASLTIGNSVEIIGDFAFGFNSLITLIIPASVHTIENSAFMWNELKNILIPDNVTLKDNAFTFNPLISVTFGENIMFDYFSANNNIFPDRLEDLYKQREGQAGTYIRELIDPEHGEYSTWTLKEQ